MEFFRGVSRELRGSIVDADTIVTWHSYGIRNTWFNQCGKAEMPPGVQPRHNPMQPWYVEWVMVPTMAFVRSVEDLRAVAAALPAASRASANAAAEPVGVHSPGHGDGNASDSSCGSAVPYTSTQLPTTAGSHVRVYGTLSPDYPLCLAVYGNMSLGPGWGSTGGTQASCAQHGSDHSTTADLFALGDATSCIPLAMDLSLTGFPEDMPWLDLSGPGG